MIAEDWSKESSYHKHFAERLQPVLDSKKTSCDPPKPKAVSERASRRFVALHTATAWQQANADVNEVLLAQELALRGLDMSSSDPEMVHLLFDLSVACLDDTGDIDSYRLLAQWRRVASGGTPQDSRQT